MDNSRGLEDTFEELANMTPEELEEDRREHRAKHLARTHEEKERDMGQNASRIYEMMFEVESFYLGSVKERMDDLDYDWRSKSEDEKLDLFDRASRQFAREIDGPLADYLKEKVSEQFKQDELDEEEVLDEE